MTTVFDPTTAGGQLRRSYGSTTLAFPGMAFPLTLGSLGPPASGALFATVSSGGNVDLVQNFDTVYFRCMVNVKVYDALGAFVTETTQQFANFAAVLAWVNAAIVGPVIQNVVTMEVYDVIDGTIPPPPKVYGKNRLWGGMIGRGLRGSYWTPDVYSCRQGWVIGAPARTARASVFAYLWDQFWPGTAPAPGAWTQNDFSCAWVSPERSTRYECPKFHPLFTLPQSTYGDRYERDITVPGPAIPVPPGQAHRWDGPGSGTALQPIAYTGIDPAGNWMGFGWGITSSMSAVAQYILHGYSIVVAYPMANTLDSNKKSIYLKPIGIDQVFFDPFDAAVYQIEAVGWNRRDKRPALRPLSVVQYNDQRMTSPVPVTDMSPVLVPSPGLVRLRGRLAGGARFQLRSLLTGMVSPLSDSQVVRRIGRARPFSLLVENGQAV